MSKFIYQQADGYNSFYYLKFEKQLLNVCLASVTITTKEINFLLFLIEKIRVTQDKMRSEYYSVRIGEVKILVVVTAIVGVMLVVGIYFAAQEYKMLKKRKDEELDKKYVQQKNRGFVND